MFLFLLYHIILLTITLFYLLKSRTFYSFTVWNSSEINLFSVNSVRSRGSVLQWHCVTRLQIRAWSNHMSQTAQTLGEIIYYINLIQILYFHIPVMLCALGGNQALCLFTNSDNLSHFFGFT